MSRITLLLLALACATSARADVFDLDMGGATSCAVQKGSLYCWGANERGQLGVGDRSPRRAPTLVNLPAGTVVTDVSVGSDHVCAIASGSVYCWGSGEGGRLGRGVYADVDALAPSKIGPLDGATDIESGRTHTCAVKDAALLCWGQNVSGELGFGTLAIATSPKAVSFFGSAAGRPVSSLALGNNFSCAVANQTGYCWGAGADGRLGNGATANVWAPAPISGAHAVDAIAAGYQFGCAIRAGDTALLCWGAAGLGGGAATQLSPIVMKLAGTATPVTGVTRVAAGVFHACAANLDGVVRCWGLDAEMIGGQSGATLSALSNAVDVAHVASSDRTVCLRGHDDSIRCVGNDEWGEAGGSPASVSPVPLPVAGLAAVASIAAGGQHTCAVDAGQVKCWGRSGDDLGFGNATEPNRATFVPVSIPLANAVSVVSGAYNSCALRDDASLYCWGYNGYGAVGDGTTAPRTAPTLIATGVIAVSMAPTGNHACAVRANGTVQCWGHYADGQLGTGTDPGPTSTMPTTVIDESDQPLTNVTAVAAGQRHSCAVSNGDVYCWGANDTGQAGEEYDTASQRARAVGGLPSGAMTSVAAGNAYTCAVSSAGTTYCWSYLSKDVLFDVPTDIGLSNVESISAGSQTLCAVLVTGEAQCLGDNRYGQLGTGAFDQPATPSVVALADVDTISVGDEHTCATSNGIAHCWGNGFYGRTGQTLGYTRTLGAPLAFPLHPLLIDGFESGE